jgi:RNA polymerase sigma-70 factor (ECF subfamily)
LNHTELLQRIASADEVAFSEFYEVFKDLVYRIAYSYLQNEQEAEELTQDVFVEIHRSAKTFNGKSSVSTWVYRIAVNKSLDKLRYLKARKRFGFISSIFSVGSSLPLEDSIADTSDHGTNADKKEDLAMLLSAMERLVANQKTALILTQLEGLKGRQAAEIIGVTEKAVEGLIQRGKENLRKTLVAIYNQRGKHTI